MRGSQTYWQSLMWLYVGVWSSVLGGFWIKIFWGLLCFSTRTINSFREQWGHNSCSEISPPFQEVWSLKAFWFSAQNVWSLALQHTALLKETSHSWRQVDRGMPTGVFVDLLAHLTAFYNGWSPILCVRRGPVRAGSWWSSGCSSFPLLQQILFLLSFLCSFLSTGSVRRLTVGSACFLTPKVYLSPQFQPCFHFLFSTLSTHS